ncbi:NAD-binding protein [Pseudanabaena sp. 'Roaring Creek']|uniref:NAD-binding protein n=1 Tax=Pseudanabaena sp. 'Roaring Creek' TaxID=1681830 RepID=UPI0009E8A80E|nr:NAD-binding protein [Pseudanabaena sp. 'Roaring Creek']
MEELPRMAFDYDLVAIGMGAYALKLVCLAAQSGARVAWICDRHSHDLTDLNIVQILDILQLLKSRIFAHSTAEKLSLFPRQIKQALQDVCPDDLWDMVQTKGVDVIIGTCKFDRKSSNFYGLEVTEFDTFATDRISQRRLTSRTYAIADDPPTPLSKIFGLADGDYLTASKLLHLENLPNSIAVLGNDVYACAIAQNLNFIGVKTYLLADRSPILPSIDVAIARTLQAQLEAEGIEIYTNARVTAVSKIQFDRSRIWLGNTTLECDRLLVPIAPRTWYIPHESYIYQCHREQDIAQILYQCLRTHPWHLPARSEVPATIHVPSMPPISQIGLTESAAKNLGRSTYVLESANENMGICKIICDRQGKILGASMYGERAKLAIKAIAMAMQGKIKIQNIEVLQELQLTEQWSKIHRHTSQQEKSQQEKLRNWFIPIH